MHLEAHGAGDLANAHRREAGVRMAGDVRERLLRDAVQHRAPGIVQGFDPGEGGEANAQALAPAQIADEGGQCRDQPEVVEQRRAQLARVAMHNLDRPFDQALGLGDSVPQAPVVDRGALLQGRQPDIDAGQDLGDLVMQLAADFLSFLLLRRQNLMCEAARLGEERSVVLRPALELCKPTSVRLGAPKRVLVVSDKGGAGAALAEQLKNRKIDVATLDDKLTPESAAEKAVQWAKAGEVGGVYFLTGLDPSPAIAEIEPATWQELNRRQIGLLCAVTRALYEALGQAGTFLITATRMGGLHGYEPAGAISPIGGAITGFTKTIARERSAAVVKAVDFEKGEAAADVARALLAETERDPDVYEIGYRDGSRFVRLGRFSAWVVRPGSCPPE